MLDLIVRRANLQDGRTGIDIACRDGRIVDIAPAIAGTAREEIDATGRLVAPPFVDAHLHADAALLHGNPYTNESGELYEGIGIFQKLKATLTVADYKERVRQVCRLAIAQGTLAIRCQTDVCDPQLRQAQALVEMREEMRPYIDLQLVAFPQDGYYRDPGAVRQLAAALDMGMDVVGGIPDYELTAALGNQSVRELCEIAVKRGLRVDFHTDQTPDPQSRQVEAVTYEFTRTGLGARGSASHCPSLSTFHDYYAGKLIAQMAQSGMNVVVCPMTASTCWGMMTRVGPLLDAGVNIAFGQDCIMDPWFPFGNEDMLDVAHFAILFGKLLSEKKKHAVFDGITYGGARALGLEDYGIERGRNADLVVLQASDPMEAIRLRAPRLAVVRRGRVLARREASEARLTLGNEESALDLTKESLFAH